MKKNKDNISYYIALVTQLGLGIVVTIGIGLYAGLYVDKKMNGTGMYTLVGILIGVGAGFLNAYRILKPMIVTKEDN